MSVVMFFCSALKSAGAFENPLTEVVFCLIAVHDVLLAASSPEVG